MTTVLSRKRKEREVCDPFWMEKIDFEIEDSNFEPSLPPFSLVLKISDVPL
jgi:hypothetical protein